MLNRLQKDKKLGQSVAILSWVSKW